MVGEENSHCFQIAEDFRLNIISLTIHFMAKTKALRGLYDEQKLIDAVLAVKNHKMTSVKAAKVYQVPGSTIRTHITKASMKFGSGRRFYLDSKQENDLVQLIKALEPMGVRITKPILTKVAGEFIELVTKDSRLKSID